MAQQEELVVQIENLTSAEREQLLEDLGKLEDVRVRNAPPSMSGPTMVDFISLFFEGTALTVTIIKALVPLINNLRQRRASKRVVGKLIDVDGNEIDLNNIEEYLKRRS